MINVKNLDPAFYYQAQGIIVGAYEEWATVPICTSIRALRVDIETPQTGIQSNKDLDTAVVLGRQYREQFRRNDGMSWTFRFNSTSIGADKCDFGDGTPKGYFYTDVNGTTLKDGPGPDTIRRYIMPRFTLNITAKFEVADKWIGHYKPRTIGFFRDHGFGVDQEVN